MKQFNCTDTHLYCDEYIRGDISLNILDAVNRHLENCSQCRDYFEKQKSLAAVVIKNYDLPQFRSVVPDVLEKIDAKRSSSRMWYVSFAAACVVAIFIYAQGFRIDAPVPETSTASAQQTIFEPGVLLNAPITGVGDDFGDI